ncbi:hypothetical protein GPECTOR_6g724 [Gonium pectorale]|uniref:Guanylate cyclase domain-containing protein n=1 Tax=Gonium pectorale TaxID=33097 RepID=A0A150GVA0_GONPE|nr:hypothetical protein GPECTOR_6g724 [Gonium pectorale]|eukprot:KXZ53806.1 hypothetical protein GPECTOR_6g724 [Gonium pectorale]
MAQTNGTKQGLWFNTTDLRPLIDSPAMPAALRLYAALASSNAAPFTPGGRNVSRSSVPVDPDELLAAGGSVDAASGAPLCGSINPLFAAGRCLFTIDWATAASRLTLEHAPAAYPVVWGGRLTGTDAAIRELEKPMTAADIQALLNMEPSDLAFAQRAIAAAIVHPNAAIDIVLPNSSAYRRVLDGLAVTALRPTPLGYAGESITGEANLTKEPTVAQQQAIDAAMRAFTRISEGFLPGAVLVQLYRQSLGLPPRDDGTNGDNKTAVFELGLGVGLGLGLALLAVVLAASCVCYFKWQGARMSELVFRSHQQPPGPGPATTLVMTDVQNSTLLWELLSQDVMDHCVSIHHRIMRESIAVYRGYEVFTEGDAFAVAFHSPEDALGFAVTVQETLLRADWPPELLQQPDGCEPSRSDVEGTSPRAGAPDGAFGAGRDTEDLTLPAPEKQPATPFASQVPPALLKLMGGSRRAVPGEPITRSLSARPSTHAPALSAPGGARSPHAIEKAPGKRFEHDAAADRSSNGRALSTGGRRYSGTGTGGERGAGKERDEEDALEAEWRTMVNWDAGMPIPLSSSGRSVFSGFGPGSFTPVHGVEGGDDGAGPQSGGVRPTPQKRFTFDGTQSGWDRSSAVRQPQVKLDLSQASITAIQAANRFSLPRFALRPMASLPSYSSFRHGGELKDYHAQMTMPVRRGQPPPPPNTPSLNALMPSPDRPQRTTTLPRLMTNASGFVGLSRFGSTAQSDQGYASPPTSNNVLTAAAAGGTAGSPPVLTKRGSIPRFAAGMAANLLPRLMPRSPSDIDRHTRHSRQTNNNSGAVLGMLSPVACETPQLPAMTPFPTSTMDMESQSLYHLPSSDTPHGGAVADSNRITAFNSVDVRHSVQGPRTSRNNNSGTEDVLDALWRDLNAATGAAGGGGDGAADTAAGTGLRPMAFCVSSVLSMLYEQLRTEDVPAILNRGARELERMLTGGNKPPRINTSGAAGAPAVLEPVLVFRGFRVRMGLHSGARDQEVLVLRSDGVQPVYSYTGDFLNTTKEIADAAMGGVVVLSGTTFRAYQQLLRQRGSRVRDIMVLHLGEHVIKAPSMECDSVPLGSAQLAAAPPPPTREMYGAVDPHLAARLALLPRMVRTHQEVVPGCMSAPAGVVAPVFCNVVGVESLLAWESLLQERNMRAMASLSTEGMAQCRPLGPDGIGGLDSSGVGIVRAALELFCDLAQKTAGKNGGYVVASSADGGHWVLVFGSAEAAVLWGLEMLEAMLATAWPEGFLEHELTEEVWKDGILHERGLRLRIGIDYGQAMVRLVPRTGRLDYVGRPMNRAARIAAKAKAASMLVSGAVWEAVRHGLDERVDARNLGSMQLKGVREQMELWAIKGRRGA